MKLPASKFFFLILRYAKINAKKNPTAKSVGRIHKTWFVDVDVFAEKKFKLCYEI